MTRSPHVAPAPSLCRRAAVVAALAVAALAIGAAPAAAHAGPGGVTRPPEDFRSTVTAVEPAVDGIVVTAAPGSGVLTLTNTSDATVTVRGYNGEPYLRVGPDGVFENRRSPATYLGADPTGAATVPPEARPDAEPAWQRVGDGPSVNWHDHRTHWMLPYDPPEVTADPTVEHVVDPAWRVPLAVSRTGGEGGTTTTSVDVVGELRWTPPPSPWPWLVLAGSVALAVAWAAASRRGVAVLRGAAVVLVATAIVDLAAMAGVSPGEPTPLGVALSLAGIGAVLTGVALLRRRPDTALVVLGISGLALGLLVGFTTRAYLTHAQVPSALEPTAARAVVALALGTGVGVGVGAVVRQQVLLRRAAPAAGDGAAA